MYIVFVAQYVKPVYENQDLQNRRIGLWYLLY